MDITEVLNCLEDHSGLMIAIFTFFLVIIAFWQLNRFNNQTRADFLYRIYKDLLAWLDAYEPIREWIFKGIDTEKLGRDRFDEWQLDEYLSFFETIWSFDKKRLIDKDIVYDLFSDFLISVYEANNLELKNIIQELRKEENKPDLYIGVEQLYNEMKNKEEVKISAK